MRSHARGRSEKLGGTSRNERKPEMTVTRVAKAVLLTAVIAGAPQALAQTHQICTAKWQSAPATDYCSQHTMHWEEPDPGQTNGCVLVANCTVNVKIGDTDRTFARFFAVTAGANDMGRLDLCFRKWDDPAAIDGWVLFIKLGCSSLDVDVATAIADGLPR